MSTSESLVLLGVAYLLGIGTLLLAALRVFYYSSWRRPGSASYPSHQRSGLSHIPLLTFEDGNNTLQRYISDTGSLLHHGYVKYLKNGQAFRIINPTDDRELRVILPHKYLDEIKGAPVSSLSFPLFFNKTLCLDYSGGPSVTELTAEVVKKDLTRNLGNLPHMVYIECIAALEDKMPECRDWTPLKPYEIFVDVIARITARVMVGPELCRNKEWLELSIGVTSRMWTASQTIPEKYSPGWRWLAPWFHPGSKVLHSCHNTAARLLEPVYQKRVAAMSSPNEEAGKPMDCIQWLLNSTNKGEIRKLMEITNEQLVLAFASIHTSSATTTSTLYDLLAHPEYFDDLQAEIEQSVAVHGQTWSRRAISQLEKLDSFMKESQRLNPINHGMLFWEHSNSIIAYTIHPAMSVQRVAVKSYTFKDGLSIPAGTIVYIPSYELSHDHENYPEPEQFDAYRFFRLRAVENRNRSKAYFTALSDEMLHFGAGAHACPGRFFAAHQIKVMLVEMLRRYEMKFPDGCQGRPPNKLHNFATMPDHEAEVLFKRKAAKETGLI